MNKHLLARDIYPLYRAIGLLLIGIGAFVVGNHYIPLENMIESHDYLSTTVIISVSVGLATGGVLLGGIPGMVLFAFGNASLGASAYQEAFPSWVYALGLPSVMAGFALRIFNPD